MPHLCPPTLTTDEQRLILRFTVKNPRDNLIFSMALGTGLRLSELIGLNVGDVFAADGKPKTRVWVRREIAKRGRTGDVFVPDKLAPKLKRFWKFKSHRGEGLEPGDPLFCSQSVGDFPRGEFSMLGGGGSRRLGSTGFTGFTRLGTRR